MAAEAIDAVKAATAREAKRTIVAKGVEDTGIYQNFQRQIRYIESTVGENDRVSTRDQPNVRDAELRVRTCIKERGEWRNKKPKTTVRRRQV